MVSRSPANETISKVQEADAPPAVMASSAAAQHLGGNGLDGNSLVDANLASLHGEPAQPCPVLLAEPSLKKTTATEALSLLLSGEMEVSGRSQRTAAEDQLRASCPFENSIRQRGPVTSSPAPLSPNPWADMDEEERVDAEDDMTGLVLGLLKLLQDILAAAPENVVRDKLESVVRLEALLVLTHNENPWVRNQVLCVSGPRWATSFFIGGKFYDFCGSVRSSPVALIVVHCTV